MSSTPQSPGVYMQEFNNGTRPIEAVGTAVAAFVGYTARAEQKTVDEQGNENVESLIGKPTLVTNWSQYVQKFGEFVKGAYLPDAVYGYFANGGGRCYIVSVKTINKAGEGGIATLAETSVKQLNNPAVQLLTFTAKEAGTSGNNIQVDIKPNETKPGTEADPGKPSTPTFNLVISFNQTPEETYENLTLRGDRDVASVLRASRLVNVKVNLPRTETKTDTAILPAAGTYRLAGGDMKKQTISLNDYRGNMEERRGIEGLVPLDDVTMIALPDLMASYRDKEITIDQVEAVQQAVINYCENVKYCFAILDAPPALSPQKMKEWRLKSNYDSSRAAIYYPWIETADMTGSNGRTRQIPPCGHVAGIFARTDETRGVHKAPANEVVRGALGLEIQVTTGEQDMLNPIGVNVIRSFPGRGIRVWGARTLSSDASWRYINVRRLFNMIEESLERGTQWVVFEPNDSNLWARVTRDVSSFLKLVWRSGALFGTTPEQAFYVKCDEETNPFEVRDTGQLIVEIGIAPVKPAEFVIFRVTQWAGPDAEG